MHCFLNSSGGMPNAARGMVPNTATMRTSTMRETFMLNMRRELNRPMRTTRPMAAALMRAPARRSRPTRSSE